MDTMEDGAEREERRRSEVAEDQDNLHAAMTAILQATYPSFPIIERALCFAAELGHQRGFKEGFREGVAEQRGACPKCGASKRPEALSLDDGVMGGIWLVTSDQVMGDGEPS